MEVENQVTWSYRVVKEKHATGTSYAIHEVYYGLNSDKDISDMPLSEAEKLGVSWTESPDGADVFLEPDDANDTEAIKQLRDTLQAQLKCLDWPMIDANLEAKRESRRDPAG